MIMHDIVELAAQVGGMHSNNPIVNLVCKSRKKRMLKEILERIDKLPEIPQAEDIYYFSSLALKWFGLDLNGYIKYFTLSDKSTASMYANAFYRSLVINIGNEVLEYEVNICSDSMSISKISHSRGYNIGTTADSIILAQLGEVIKLGLKEICTNMVFRR